MSEDHQYGDVFHTDRSLLYDRSGCRGEWYKDDRITGYAADYLICRILWICIYRIWRHSEHSRQDKSGEVLQGDHAGGTECIWYMLNVLLSVGTPGIPGGAIASFAALATMAGLPAGVMGVYISINTLCDMGATCVNVIGDMAGCVVLKEKIEIEK